MSASIPQPKQSATPPANMKWLVAIITGVLVIGTSVAILAARAAGLATAPGLFGTRASLLADINLPGVIPLAQASSQAAAAPGEGGARDAHNHAQYMAAMGVPFGEESP